MLERGSDMVLAAHFTPLGGRLGLVAQTVETVRFSRPERVDFRLVRGPVPHVVEAFTLAEQPGGAGTLLAYHGEIAADLWRLGPVVERVGGAPLGADGRGVAGGGQGRSGAARGSIRGTPAPTRGRQRLRAANGVMSFGGYGERRHGSHQRARLAGPAWLPPADAACPPSAA